MVLFFSMVVLLLSKFVLFVFVVKVALKIPECAQ